MLYSVKENNERKLRDCFATFATGVAIAATNYDKKIYGLTINSFTSVSLDPALLLFAIDNKSSNLEIFKKSQNFSINILSKKQLELAKEFAKSANEEKLIVENYNLTKYNNPIFENSLGFFECQIYRIFEAGDHHILIGQIIDFAKMNEQQALFYHFGKFC